MSCIWFVWIRKYDFVIACMVSLLIVVVKAQTSSLLTLGHTESNINSESNAQQEIYY